MGSPGHIRRAVSCHLCDKLLVRTVDPSRYHNECVHALAVKIRTVESVKRIKENIDTLVLVFITSAYADKHGIFRYFLTRHRRSDFNQFVSGRIAFIFIFSVISRRKTVFKAVRSHHIDVSSEELPALHSSQITYCREYVSILSRFLLK